MSKKNKRNDLILIGVVLVIAIVSFMVFNLYRGNTIAKGEVVVKVDGKTFGTYDLNTDQKIPIKSGDHVNVLEIKEGKAKMIEADCPDQVCVNQKAIDRNLESIICLPNKIVVEIKGEESAVDTTAN